MIPGKDIAFDLRNRKSTSVTAAQASGILPAGGAAGTILTKTSAADYDVSWATNNAINKVRTTLKSLRLQLNNVKRLKLNVVIQSM